MDIDKKQIIIFTRNILNNMQMIPDRDIASILIAVPKHIGLKFISKGNGRNILFVGEAYENLCQCIELISRSLEFEDGLHP